MTEKTTDLRNLRKEISELSSNLKLLDSKKEENYRELTEISSKLTDLLKQANELKVNKLSISKQIKQKKKRRDELNSKVSKLATTLKEIKPQRRMRRNQIQTDSLQKQILDLTMKLQTEVFNFKKEQAIMSRLKELKQKFKMAQKEEGAVVRYFDARKQLIDFKTQADAAHKFIQEVAKKNSDVFDNLATVSKKIANLKDKRRQLKMLITVQKKAISKIDRPLADKLRELSKNKKQYDDFKFNSIRANLIKRTKEVKNKLKQKQKLTTEDILAMQRDSAQR